MARVATKKPVATALDDSQVRNSAEESIDTGRPYTVRVKLVGTTDILFHRWDNAAVAEKAAAKKGSEAKKTDSPETFVFRDQQGYICIPGLYFRSCLIASGKSFQDPRSPRKSMADLLKAIIVVDPELASLGVKAWDYESAMRVKIQMNAITRIRPAMRAGWEAEFRIQVLSGEYLKPATLHEIISNAGKFVGLADYRPTYGRFRVVEFAVEDLG